MRSDTPRPAWARGTSRGNRPSATVLDASAAHRDPRENRFLDTTCGSDAQGAYQIQVRLFDGTTGERHTRASGGFEVSDATASLTGVVRAADGTPFDGPGGDAMTLDAGRRVVSATVLGADGVHRAALPSLVEIDAAGTAATVDLETAAPLLPGGKR